MLVIASPRRKGIVRKDRRDDQKETIYDRKLIGERDKNLLDESFHRDLRREDWDAWNSLSLRYFFLLGLRSAYMRGMGPLSFMQNSHISPVENGGVTRRGLKALEGTRIPGWRNRKQIEG